MARLSPASGRGDDGLIRFIQQWCGYCLTGVTTEHALIFVCGNGGNGKGVFLNTLRAIMGAYAVTAGMEVFAASKFDRHPTELAMLHGARLVTASETEEGRAWAEARIKNLTGGDPITARYMRQDNFTFTPSFKLTIIGNHKPVLHSVDDAVRRRFNIVPFNHKPDQADPDLEAKLRDELPGILQWAIAGCLDWQQNRLVRPESVQEETSDYFDDQDVIGQWIAECCTIDQGNDHRNDRISDLFQSFKSFAEKLGDPYGTSRSLSSALVKRGFPRRRSKGAKMLSGISLNLAETARMTSGSAVRAPTRTKF